MLLFVVAVAALGGATIGYAIGITGAAEQFVQHQFGLSSVALGVVVGALVAGLVIGALLGGRFADKFGRRRLLIVTAWISAALTVASAFSPDPAALSITRFLLGVSAGMASTVVSLYLGEISPADRRGGLVSVYQLAFSATVFVAYGVGTVLAGSGNWRLMIGIGAVFAIAQGVGMIWAPESPRYLVWHGRIEAARTVLHRFDPVSAEADLAGLVEARRGVDKSMSFKQIVNSPVRFALIIVLVIVAAQQFTGIGALLFYLPRIFQGAGFTSPTVAIGLGVIVQGVNFACTAVTVRYVDRWGRRPMLIAGVAGVAVSLAFIGLGLRLAHGHDIFSWFPVVFAITYRAFYALSLGPLTFVLISEMFPQEARGRAASLAVSLIWFGELILAVFFPTMLEAVGAAQSFWIFAAVAVAAFIFVVAKVPETKGRTLESITRGASPPS